MLSPGRLETHPLATEERRYVQVHFDNGNHALGLQSLLRGLGYTGQLMAILRVGLSPRIATPTRPAIQIWPGRFQRGSLSG